MSFFCGKRSQWWQQINNLCKRAKLWPGATPYQKISIKSWPKINERPTIQFLESSYEDCNVIFVDAPSGTGKCFIINAILKNIHSLGKIALGTVSSGIAAICFRALSRSLLTVICKTSQLQISNVVLTWLKYSGIQLLLWLMKHQWNQCTKQWISHFKTLRKLSSVWELSPHFSMEILDRYSL